MRHEWLKQAKWIARSSLPHRGSQTQAEQKTHRIWRDFHQELWLWGSDEHQDKLQLINIFKSKIKENAGNGVTMKAGARENKTITKVFFNKQINTAQENGIKRKKLNWAMIGLKPTCTMQKKKNMYGSHNTSPVPLLFHWVSWQSRSKLANLPDWSTLAED